MEKNLIHFSIENIGAAKISSRVKETGEQIVYFKCMHTYTHAHTHIYTHGNKGDKKLETKRRNLTVKICFLCRFWIQGRRRPSGNILMLNNMPSIV